MRRRRKFRTRKRKEYKSKPVKWQTHKARGRRRIWSITLGAVLIAIIGIGGPQAIHALALRHQSNEVRRQQNQPGQHVYAHNYKRGTMKFSTLDSDPSLLEWIHIRMHSLPIQHFHVVYNCAQYEAELAHATNFKTLPVPDEISHPLYFEENRAQGFIDQFKALRNKPVLQPQTFGQQVNRAQSYLKEKIFALWHRL